MSIRHFLIDRPTKGASQFQHLKIKKETGNSVNFSPMPGNHSLNSELLRTLNQNSQRPTTQRSNQGRCGPSNEEKEKLCFEIKLHLIHGELLILLQNFKFES